MLSLDSEWNNEGPGSPVSLLQISTHRGYCVLFQLNNLKRIPLELEIILKSRKIFKIGVGIIENDVKNLRYGNGIVIENVFDLRYLAREISETATSLAKMSEEFLGIKLNKRMTAKFSGWSQPVLSPKQIQYAANDATAGMEIFEKILKEFTSGLDGLTNKQRIEILFKYYKDYIDVLFKDNNFGKHDHISLGEFIFFLKTRSINLVENLHYMDMGIWQLAKWMRETKSTDPLKVVLESTHGIRIQTTSIYGNRIQNQK